MWFAVGVLVLAAGWARLESEAQRDGTIVPWVLPRSIKPEQLDGLFRLNWIHRYEPVTLFAFAGLWSWCWLYRPIRMVFGLVMLCCVVVLVIWPWCLAQ